jgi:superfamily II DNA or RNA helicase
MSLTLRPYQSAMLDAARAAMQQHRRILLVSPTGSGKTALTVSMMRTAAKRGLTSMFCVHQNELLRQTSRALWAQQLEHGVVAAGKRHSKLPAQVASVQTLVRRLDAYPEPNLIVVDEAHRGISPVYMRIFNHWPRARIVGLTATPERTDGKGLGQIFETIVEGPTIRSLIDDGWLCAFELMAPPQTVDLDGVRTSMGDFDQAEVESRMDKPAITGDAVEHYAKHARGKRCVVMCVTIKHAEHVAEQYRAAGVPAECIHGWLSDGEREAALQRFARGQTLVLTNVQLMVEGVDIPSIEVVQWLRPTKSLIIWMQGNGRGLRPSPGKNRLLILDHVGNWSRPGFGMPDDPRVWSLEGRKERQKREPVESFEVKQCEMCYTVYRAHLAACPNCSAAAKPTQREIEVVAGELAKIEQRHERREQGKARTLHDLVALGMRKGMTKPAEWAAIMVAARVGRKPGPVEFAEARKVHAGIVAAAAPSEPVF